ncbi:hypothetical protein [Bradyrhizobium viridifuturi]|uniref:hypothetical protein n=1 Tax=Bradyrhizobium viridifuturi TaxID=1654716 RepID=UPI00067ED11A|nr:hypothetical protein [Bradyrhizobium viridifuturi]
MADRIVQRSNQFEAVCKTEAARIRAEQRLSEDAVIEIEMTPEMLALLDRPPIEIVEEIS